ncbi:MAG: hypothetical protein K6E51_03970 [Treponema sp.]|nr:hypothetical protein [Treponema sp.]
MDIETAAAIIINDWLYVKRNEVFYFITDEYHTLEAKACIQQAEQRGAITKLTILPQQKIQDGQLLETIRNIMSYADVVVGATTYSFITTDAVDFALKHGARFLSLPLSTNTGDSLFKSHFLSMNPKVAERNAKRLLPFLKKASTLHVTTPAGTDATFSMRGRRPGFFSGKATRHGTFTSASFEVYIPIIENSANGTVIIDGSLGYLGAVTHPVRVQFIDGKMNIDTNQNCDTNHYNNDAKRLSEYIRTFNDPRMSFAVEFGIGLNECAHCVGDSYIEDESTAGTFHIGLGRNLALGGTHDAAGHFDIVMHKPDIYADSIQILSHGQICV